MPHGRQPSRGAASGQSSTRRQTQMRSVLVVERANSALGYDSFSSSCYVSPMAPGQRRVGGSMKPGNRSWSWLLALVPAAALAAREQVTFALYKWQQRIGTEQSLVVRGRPGDRDPDCLRLHRPVDVGTTIPVTRNRKRLR